MVIHPAFLGTKPTLTTPDQAAKRRAQVKKEATNRTLITSRGSGPPGEPQADGWSVVGGSTPRPSSKAGDLSNFGKISKSGRGARASKNDATKRDSNFTSVNPSSNA